MCLFIVEGGIKRGVKCLGPMRKGWGYSDLFYYKSPSLVGVVVKALDGTGGETGP